MAAGGGVAVESDCPKEGDGEDAEPKLSEMTGSWAWELSA